MPLSVNQARFKDFLEKLNPRLSTLFDWEEKEVNLKAVESYLSYASSGEAALCRFVVGLWLGRNQFNFDIFKADTLPEEQRKIIAEWLQDPFWP